MKIHKYLEQGSVTKVIIVTSQYNVVNAYRNDI